MKRGATSQGKGPTAVTGGGMHLHFVQHVFDCPICTCENDISAKLEKNPNPVFNVKCCGCKRKLEIFSDPITGQLTATEVL